jgi:hypothetical protein
MLHIKGMSVKELRKMEIISKLRKKSPLLADGITFLLENKHWNANRSMSLAFSLGC